MFKADCFQGSNVTSFLVEIFYFAEIIVGPKEVRHAQGWGGQPLLNPLPTLLPDVVVG